MKESCSTKEILEQHKNYDTFVTIWWMMPGMSMTWAWTRHLGDDVITRDFTSRLRVCQGTSPLYVTQTIKATFGFCINSLLHETRSLVSHEPPVIIVRFQTKLEYFDKFSWKPIHPIWSCYTRAGMTGLRGEFFKLLVSHDSNTRPQLAGQDFDRNKTVLQTSSHLFNFHIHPMWCESKIIITWIYYFKNVSYIGRC